MTTHEIIRAIAVLPMRNEPERWLKLTDTERRFVDYVRYTAPNGVRLDEGEILTLRRLVEKHGQ